MSIPSTLIAGFIRLASCGSMGARIVHSLWLIEADPHRGGSISLMPLGGLGLLGLPYRVTSAFCEHLAREHLAQPHGPMWRGDLPGENLFRSHASTVILGIRVISCANNRSFERDTGKQALSSAISVDCGYGRDR